MLRVPQDSGTARTRSSRADTTPHSEARAVTRRSRAPRSASTPSATTHGQWDPKNQRPELWNLYNARIRKGESIRVFPISNWTELDVWLYIHLEQIPVVPMYFAKEQPIVMRDGRLIPVYERTRLLPGETPEMTMCRFRTLGCYPCTGAVHSSAQTVPEIVRGDDGRPQLRADHAADRSRPGQLDGAEEAGGVLLIESRTRTRTRESLLRVRVRVRFRS